MRFLFDRYVLDVDRSELHLGTERVALEPRVYDLLVYLITNRHRVVSKDDVLDAVWAGRIVSESALTTRIAAARQAIGDSGEAQKLIRTIARKGFRFVGEVRDEAALPAEPGAAATVTPAIAPLPINPSIAVLAFDNLSSDPEQAFISDGIANDIITELSYLRSLFVIARNSSFTYKGRAVDVRQISRELGVRYVVSGTVRRAGSQMRITAQLIDAESGGHVWAGRYDRALTELFAVQDEITGAIVAAIVPAVSQAEQLRAMRKSPDNLDAWEAYQRGLGILTEASDDDIAAARAFLSRSVELDPHFAPAHAMLAHVTMNETSRGGRVMEAGIRLAEQHARRAVALDKHDPGALATLSWLCSWRGDLNAALAYAEQTVTANPNDARAHLVKARALICAGRPVEADPELRIASRLSPRDPFTRLIHLHAAWSAYFQRDYVAAAEAARQTTRDFPDYPHSYLWYAAALGQMRRGDEARAALRRAIDVSPPVFAGVAKTRPPWFRPEDHEHLLEGLYAAGWNG